ncbi:MAG: Hsp33 family molecular chaperone HslO [Steroidobacteraceae bacterium]
MSDTDSLRRFLFESEPLRGHVVKLDSAWRQLRAHQQYPPEIEVLLGEAACATVLLAATLKFQGSLTLQITGSGRVRLLVVQCTHDFGVRGVARLRDDVPEVAVAGRNEDFHALLGEGQVTVSIDTGEGGAPYQGIVPLQGASLAQCLEQYFGQSEQLPTRLALRAEGSRAAGLLLQQLPASAVVSDAQRVQEIWATAGAAIDRLPPGALLQDDAASLLRVCFANEDVRLFAPVRVRFECRCSPERVAGLLQSLGAAEVRSVLAEQGAVTVTCEFCQRPYRFDAVDVERLFAPGAMSDGPTSIN